MRSWLIDGACLDLRSVVGWVADGAGGLANGLVYSAVALWAGALLAWRQKPLPAGAGEQPA